MAKSKPKAPFVLDPDLDGLATDLRKKFAEAKTEQMGRRYTPAERFRNMSIWYGVARKCLELHADPDDFIEAAFLFCSVPGGPFPQNLASRAMDRWYGEAGRFTSAKPLAPGETLFSRRLDGKVQAGMLLAIRLAGANKIRLRDVVADDKMLRTDMCPAHVRMLLFPQDPEVAKRWRNEARAEIQTNPRLLLALKQSHYDLTWL